MYPLTQGAVWDNSLHTKNFFQVCCLQKTPYLFYHYTIMCWITHHHATWPLRELATLSSWLWAERSCHAVAEHPGSGSDPYGFRPCLCLLLMDDLEQVPNRFVPEFPHLYIRINYSSSYPIELLRSLRKFKCLKFLEHMLNQCSFLSLWVTLWHFRAIPKSHLKSSR